MSTPPIVLSVIIPVFNEEDNLDPLHKALKTVLDDQNKPYEIIMVDDGSTDGSQAKLAQIAKNDPTFKVVNFLRNYGQTAALMAGIEKASGEILIPMDADLQNDPKDIPRLLQKLDEGFDVVSGWRKDRQDKAITRTIPSMIANKIISKISGLVLHDYGCTLKVYRRDVIKGVRLYGEMHRFIPIYAKWQGAQVTEIPVSHNPRIHGISKYGLNRIFKVILDLIVVWFMENYFTKPIYLFGSFGLFFLLVSLLSGILAVYLRIFHNISFISTPMPLAAVMSFMVGIIAILLGLVAEMVVRTYYESQRLNIYTVRGTINIDEPT
ncbi:MAG: glycosyltransferase family 2 protein [Magnetococcales bacterium]|nr:glycosyltransferase family 2 protein [Magnetococcales bacterium]